MIVRTVIAYCDATDLFEDGDTKDCFSKATLNPDGSQPFVALQRLGWRTETTPEGIKTICPKHGERVEKP